MAWRLELHDSISNHVCDLTVVSTNYLRVVPKQLVVIDDFGMSPIDAEVQDDLLSLLDDRRDDGTSLIIASQRPLSDWYAYLGGDMHADAILDRLKNSSYIIELRGRSLRESTAVARKLKAVNKKEAAD